MKQIEQLEHKVRTEKQPRKKLELFEKLKEFKCILTIDQCKGKGHPILGTIKYSGLYNDSKKDQKEEIDKFKSIVGYFKKRSVMKLSAFCWLKQHDKQGKNLEIRFATDSYSMPKI